MKLIFSQEDRGNIIFFEIYQYTGDSAVTFKLKLSFQIVVILLIIQAGIGHTSIILQKYNKYIMIIKNILNEFKRCVR